ncbi:MAG: peptidase U32 family protein [Anaerorhabdus sp.]|uniref:peptidase U32 family protein n=1 Tax=Anaerorhabdus sp. TaxID=1872524 RepID=UPI003A8559AD
MELVVTIEDINDIQLYAKAGATVFLFADEFHGTRVAKKMTLDEIAQGCAFAKALNLKTALMMNRIYTDAETSKIDEMLRFVKDIGMDWVYYNDPAVFMCAEEVGLVSHLVYEPDTLMTNSKDMQFVLDQGVHHAVLSTEITLDEMKTMTRNVNGNTEAIVFGYLNMSYSKRHLIQNYCDEIGIENTYQDALNMVLIESTREGKMPIIEDAQGTHIFTDYVLDAFNEIVELNKEGLQIVRVDGIFLSRDRIADACRAFRMILSGLPSEIIKQKFEEKYPKIPWSTGYMYQKTNLVK